MTIVDAQVHIWADATPERPWPAESASRPHQIALSSTGLLQAMDAAGVARAILVPPSWEGLRNDLGLAAIATHPDRFALMGRLALDDPKQRALVATCLADGMLGLRFSFLNDAQRQQLTDGSIDWLWSAAERAGVPLMLLAPGCATTIDNIAQRHPGLRLTLDHMNLSSSAPATTRFDEVPDVAALARHPNVAVKASCLPFYSSLDYPFQDMHAPFRQVFDAFGPQRTFWGSDLSRLRCSYRQCITLFTEHFDWLSSAELEQIMGRGICAWLGWPLPSADATPVIKPTP
jgi:L-fuconolactonase